MATTNAQIIETYKTAHNIPLSTPLYTYAAWRSMGYQVRKGEASRHKIQMWKYVPGARKPNTEAQEAPEGKRNKCFMKTVYLFTQEQVERMV